MSFKPGAAPQYQPMQFHMPMPYMFPMQPPQHQTQQPDNDSDEDHVNVAVDPKHLKIDQQRFERGFEFQTIE